jgi:hypothetical protein
MDVNEEYRLNMDTPTYTYGLDGNGSKCCNNNNKKL